MSRKFYFTIMLSVALVAFGHLSGFAQTAPVSGTVELKKADGTREPVVGALIDVYRTDVKSGFPSAKTGKKGEFAFAGLTLGGTFTFGISAPNCAPTIFPGVKAGQEKLIITMSPGDGSKLSEADVRKGAVAKTGGTTAELTAEEKKAQAEYEKKTAEITAKNEKIKNAGEIVARTLKEGNDAFTAKNYDLAIAKYSEGLDAEPDFVGSAPVLLNNRGASYSARAVETYNKTVKSTDATLKVEGMGKVRKDLLDSSASFTRAWNITKNAPVADIADPKANDANKLGALRGIRDTFRYAVLTEQVDPAVIEDAKVMIPEFLALESDAAKKAEASLIFADLYRVTADSDNAIAAYKKILETSPENADALVGVGLSLVNNGYIKDDKAQLQEGANYLQKFVTIAPDSHKYKANAIEAIATLKSLSNVAPQKLPAGGKKKP
ncbi:MAG: hypothetical protein ACKVQJ_08530 [Pyrinomonadaceae bacterium]